MVALSGRTGDGHTWQLAPSLITLAKEVDKRHPGRSTASDGSIASAQHSIVNPTSDHEVDRGDGLVKALDLTDDDIPPGFDCTPFINAVVARRDDRTKYIIHFPTGTARSLIWRSYDKPGLPAWTPSPYYGSNPHKSHAHISVTDAGANDTRTWFTNSQEGPFMALSDAQQKKLADDVAFLRIRMDAGGSSGGLVRPTWEWVSWLRKAGVPRLIAQVSALQEVVNQLGAGGDVDYARVQQAVEDGIKSTLGSLDE